MREYSQNVNTLYSCKMADAGCPLGR